MSTPPSEPDSYAGAGGSDQDVRRHWAVRPGVPGWGSDYTGPIYDDTGWHIDLSGVDWGADVEPDDDSEPYRPRQGGRGRRTTLRFRNPESSARTSQAPAADGSPGYPGAPARPTEPPTARYGGYDYQADAPTVRRSRPSGGRHARPVWPDQEPPSRPGGQPPARPGSQPGTRSGGRIPAGLRRVAPPPGTARPAPPAPAALPGDGWRGPAVRDPAPPGIARPGGPAVRDPAPPGIARPGGPAVRDPAPPGIARPGDGWRGPAVRDPAPPGIARPGGAAPGTVPPGAATPGEALPGTGQGDLGSASIVRSSGVMAVGTLGSRLTGFLRTIVQSYALGAIGVGVAYNLSNTLPNVVYNLALGGILTSVIVPLIVNAANRDGGRGGYDQRMFTLVTLALAAVTLVATAAAVPIVHLYAGSKILHSAATLHLSVIFALFFIPQIFFYGMSSLIGAVLNSRGSFAAPMWTPIVNNVVVIGVLGLYVAMAGRVHLAFLDNHPGRVSGTEVALLGLGTTFGIVAQTVALMPALRRVGFRWRPRTDFRRFEVAEIGQMAGWMFGYVATTQVAFLVTTKVAGDASQAAIVEYNYAWLLFQLPYAVVGISVITALLPRMSAHAAARRYRLVRQDFSAGTRLSSTIVVPCSLLLAVLGPTLAELFLGHGAMTAAQARYTGVVFAVFCLGLLPYMVFQLQLRVFYALHDSKTPAVIGVVTMVVNIVANVVALNSLPGRSVVAGLGVGFGLANFVGMVISWRILTRRLHGLDGYLISRSLVRMHAAALPAALLAVVVGIITGNAIIIVIIGGGLGTAMYLMFARALRIDELASLTRIVMARLGR